MEQGKKGKDAWENDESVHNQKICTGGSNKGRLPTVLMPPVHLLFKTERFRED